MLHLITSHGRIMPPFAELLLSLSRETCAEVYVYNVSVTR